MKTKIVLLVVFLLGAKLTLTFLDNNSDVLLTNQLAVAQLEDSDEAKVAMDVGGRIPSFVRTVIQVSMVGVVLLAAYSERKRLKEYVGKIVDDV